MTMGNFSHVVEVLNLCLVVVRGHAIYHGPFLRCPGDFHGKQTGILLLVAFVKGTSFPNKLDLKQRNPRDWVLIDALKSQNRQGGLEVRVSHLEVRGFWWVKGG